MANSSADEIYLGLKRIKNPVQFIDSRIDVDAFCSALAMYHILKEHFGITLTLCYEKSIPQRYYELVKDLIEVPQIKQNCIPKFYDFSKHDSMICTDTGNLAHVSGISEFVRPENILIFDIDHHAANKGYGDFNYVKELGSACTVIYELLKKWRVQPDKQIATSLLAGIITDTGFYKYNSTTEQDFEYSSELIEYGASHFKISWNLNFNQTIDDINLKKLIFNNLTIDLKNKIAYTTITLKELEDNHIDMDNSAIAPSDEIKSIKGIDYAFTVKEIISDEYSHNISVRSRIEDFNCIALVKLLNPISGGHKMAAGANIKAKSIDDAISLVIDTAKKVKSQENS